eukprot:5519389-Pleurochrysis_carterae.AAC.1
MHVATSRIRGMIDVCTISASELLMCADSSSLLAYAAMRSAGVVVQPYLPRRRLSSCRSRERPDVDRVLFRHVVGNAPRVEW